MTILKKIWNIASTVLVVLMVLAAVFLMGSRIIGYQCFNIISPSMEPQYSVGDLIYVKKVDPATIKVNDVITFVINEELAVGTHRVVRVDAENQRLYTKGDANEIEDQDPVHFNNVIGVPKFSIPKLGYVSDFIQNPPGMYITIGVGIVLQGEVMKGSNGCAGEMEYLCKNMEDREDTFVTAILALTCVLDLPDILISGKFCTEENVRKIRERLCERLPEDRLPDIHVIDDMNGLYVRGLLRRILADWSEQM